MKAIIILLLLATNISAEIITAYCSCTKCCGPNAIGTTASGIKPKESVTCASNKYKFGTKLNIKGIGIRIVQDRISKKYNDRIDIYFNNHKDALKFGKQQHKVTIAK